MMTQILKNGLLIRLLVKYVFLYFSLMFMACLIGHTVSVFFSSRSFDFKFVQSSLIYALLITFITTIIYWTMYKDIFRFLTNNNTEVPKNRNISKTVIPYKSFKIEDFIVKLNELGFLITYLNKNNNIIKIRQKLTFFNGCGALLRFDTQTQELTVISFSLNENILNDHSKRVEKFNNKLSAIFEILEI